MQSRLWHIANDRSGSLPDECSSSVYFSLRVTLPQTSLRALPAAGGPAAGGPAAGTPTYSHCPGRGLRRRPGTWAFVVPSEPLVAPSAFQFSQRQSDTELLASMATSIRQWALCENSFLNISIRSSCCKNRCFRQTELHVQEQLGTDGKFPPDGGQGDWGMETSISSPCLGQMGGRTGPQNTQLANQGGPGLHQHLVTLSPLCWGRTSLGTRSPEARASCSRLPQACSLPPRCCPWTGRADARLSPPGLPRSGAARPGPSQPSCPQPPLRSLCS